MPHPRAPWNILEKPESQTCTVNNEKKVDEEGGGAAHGTGNQVIQLLSEPGHVYDSTTVQPVEHG